MVKHKLKKFFIFLSMMIISIISVLIHNCDNENINKILNYFGVESLSTNLNNSCNLIVTIIDVGHGDSILINSEDENNIIHSALIDTGSAKYAQDVIKVLEKKQVKNLDFIMISHMHSDHMGALAEILKSYNTNEIILPNYFKIKDKLLNIYNIRSIVKSKNINVKNVNASQEISIGKSYFYVLYPIIDKKTKLPKDLNDSSIVGTLKYGNFKMMFTGDATSNIERKIINNYKENELKSNILKLAHHGSKTSSSLQFLKIVKPDCVVISSGYDKNIIYPHPDIKKRLIDLNLNYYNTMSDGDITITVGSDGYEISTAR